MDLVLADPNRSWEEKQLYGDTELSSLAQSAQRRHKEFVNGAKQALLGGSEQNIFSSLAKRWDGIYQMLLKTSEI